MANLSTHQNKSIDTTFSVLWPVLWKMEHWKAEKKKPDSKAARQSQLAAKKPETVGVRTESGHVRKGNSACMEIHALKLKNVIEQ